MLNTEYDHYNFFLKYSKDEFINIKRIYKLPDTAKQDTLCHDIFLSSILIRHSNMRSYLKSQL